LRETGAGCPPFLTAKEKIVENISPALLAWFYANRRSLPFREEPTPYHIWVSEIMLQQTRVTAALPYYERFVRELPDIPALAACAPERLHKLWEGLGYYSRVRNLQKAAQIVCAQYGGRLPADYEALRALPGIGDYTAGAIGSIGFGLAVPAVDGNVLRVFARLYNNDVPIDTPTAKRLFTARVMEHQPPEAPGDYNQALMELGALVCLPGGAPQCGVCPLAAQCEARRAGRDRVLALPVKHAPKERRVVPVAVALVRSPDGWLVQRRPEKGLLAGLWQPVLWENERWESEAAARCALQALGLALGPETGTKNAEPLPPAKHIFSHIEWRMSGWRIDVPRQRAPAGCVWATPAQLREEYALPGAFKAYKGQMLQQVEKP
jgi:A/G-specific adenine glycosylase